MESAQSPRTSLPTARFGALQLARLDVPDDPAARSASVPASPRMPAVAVAGKSEPPRPLKVRRVEAVPTRLNATLTPARAPFVAPVPAPSSNTTAIRVEEIRSIAREVASRDVESKKAARIHAVGVRFDGVAAEESALALERMFPHLARPSLLTIAARVVFFVGYLALALSAVGVRAVHQVPRLAAQARDGLRAAWARAASRSSDKRSQLQ